MTSHLLSAIPRDTEILRTVVVDGVRWVYTRRDGWQVTE